MTNRNLIRSGICAFITAALALAFTPPAYGQAAETVVDQLAEALNFYAETDFDKGIEVASSLLVRDDLTAKDSIAILETLSIITYAKGEQYLRKSVEYLEKISKIGPCVTHLPQEIWPQELRDNWYKLLKQMNKMSCDQSGPTEISTIAIMEFDNHSIGEYQEKLGSLAKGLADFFQHDFSKISSLRVVERDKIDFILKEIELQQSGSVDVATAVKVGKILGAQIMVFGSITQLDDDNTRMVVRAVKVETSEIIASVDKEGKPEYSKMEKELVKELAGLLDLQLTDKISKMIDEGGTESVDATTFYSMGLEYMDRYDYKNAYESFKKAYELDDQFVEAKRKMEIYRPLVG
ncbi:MAG: CsgG/HfaB family protein [Candidatus Zixiibacteriota bacterium]